jgi:DNA-binding NtrC family response regulator
MTRILVVDDRPKARGLLAEAAQVSGAEVMTAGSAEEAIQTIEREAFDVIVTDLQMETPKAGLEVLKAAKKKDIYTQVIVITAYGTPQISVETMSLGAFDYLEKNAPGTDVIGMIISKVGLALDYRNAKLRESTVR